MKIDIYISVPRVTCINGGYNSSIFCWKFEWLVSTGNTWFSSITCSSCDLCIKVTVSKLNSQLGCNLENVYLILLNLRCAAICKKTFFVPTIEHRRVQWSSHGSSTLRGTSMATSLILRPDEDPSIDICFLWFFYMMSPSRDKSILSVLIDVCHKRQICFRNVLIILLYLLYGFIRASRLLEFWLPFPPPKQKTLRWLYCSIMEIFHG